MFRLKETNGLSESYQELSQEQVMPEEALQKDFELIEEDDENVQVEQLEPKSKPKTKSKSKPVDGLTIFKLKASYLFSQSLKNFVMLFFKSTEAFLRKTFFFVIFLVNAYFFYSDREIIACSVFFVLCMCFYYIVKRIELKKEELRIENESTD